MTVWQKIFSPLLWVVVSTAPSVAQPCLKGVSEIQAIHCWHVEPRLEKVYAMPETPNPAPKNKPLPAGSWGGEHISMEVTREQTKVEYDCAHGTIPSGILLDSRGRFVAKGTHVEEHGGPTRQADDPQSLPVQFKGSVKGKTMKLTVTRTDTRELIGTFRLTHGQQSELVKCR